MRHGGRFMQAIEGRRADVDRLMDRLRADPALIPNAAQEIIRWQSPVTHMRRTCMADTELGGQAIRRGEKVILWYISANRDESVFPQADLFDVGRDNARRHVASNGVGREDQTAAVNGIVGSCRTDARQGRLRSRVVHIDSIT